MSSDTETRFVVIKVRADGKMDKHALKTLGKALPDNMMLVTLPDPLDADGAQMVTERFSECLRLRLEDGE